MHQKTVDEAVPAQWPGRVSSVEDNLPRTQSPCKSRHTLWMWLPPEGGIVCPLVGASLVAMLLLDALLVRGRQRAPISTV